MALILDCSSGLRGDIEGAGENEAKKSSFIYEDMLRRVLDVQSLEDDVVEEAMLRQASESGPAREDLAEPLMGRASTYAGRASTYGATNV